MAEYKRITELVIDRSRWLRGQGPDSMLLDSRGRMCCLGFACVEAGVEADRLLHAGSPEDVGSSHDLLTVPVLSRVKESDDEDGGVHRRVVDTALSQEAIGINDDEEMEDTAREVALAELFAREGIAVTFVGEGKP